MKILYQLLTLLIPLVAMGQRKIEGTYLFPMTTSFSFVTQILTINKEGQFKYFYSDCSYLQLGQGRIEETKDSIKLLFERMSKANYQSFDIRNETGDSLTVRLKGHYDGDASMIAGGTMVLKIYSKELYSTLMDKLN